MSTHDRLTLVGALGVLVFLALAALVAAPAALDTLQGEAGHHYVTDLDSHLAMCEEPDILDRPDCIRVAYETWED